jgi:site-specific DNA-cytosine methylase
MKYASIIPLIGGENFGIQKANNNQLPEYILTYSPFKANEEHFIKHLREKENWDGQYITLDETGEKPSVIRERKVDVVNTVCPCAGLSMLSQSKSDSDVRDTRNEWMLKTTEYVLSEISPRVFWGENAPQLFTTMGEGVKKKLYDLGKKYGYTLNLYYTRSMLHGNCQIRPRTFYFFTKSIQCPVFPWIKRDAVPIEDVLKMQPKANDPMARILVNNDNPKENPWVQYTMHKLGANTITEAFEKIDKSIRCLAAPERTFGVTLNEVADWFKEQGFDEKHVNKALHMQKKVNAGKNYWTHGVIIPKGIISSYIGVLASELINPFTEKYISYRDALNIMSMPENFELLNPSKSLNHICQNVPVNTAADMARFVNMYLDGGTETVATDLFKQSNVNEQTYYEIERNSLF